MLSFQKKKKTSVILSSYFTLVSQIKDLWRFCAVWPFLETKPDDSQESVQNSREDTESIDISFKMSDV